MLDTVNVFDSVNNRALGTAKATVTRYYVSTDAASTAAGVYVVLACADDASAAKETIETNNCANSSVFFVTK